MDRNLTIQRGEAAGIGLGWTKTGENCWRRSWRILWRFSLSLRRALLFLPDKSRRPPQPRNPLLHRFGLRRPAIVLRKLLRAGGVIDPLAILE